MVQLSNDMETYCYSINEALSYGVPVVTTPLSVLNEFNLTDDMRITMQYDMSNADEVAREIFEKKRKEFKYKAPEDNWSNILVNEPTTYDYKAKVKVKATSEWRNRNIVDKDRGIIPEENEIWEIDQSRWEELESFMMRTGITLVEKTSKDIQLRLGI